MLKCQDRDTGFSKWAWQVSVTVWKAFVKHCSGAEKPYISVVQCIYQVPVSWLDISLQNSDGCVCSALVWSLDVRCSRHQRQEDMKQASLFWFTCSATYILVENKLQIASSGRNLSFIFWLLVISLCLTFFMGYFCLFHFCIFKTKQKEKEKWTSTSSLITITLLHSTKTVITSPIL